MIKAMATLFLGLMVSCFVSQVAGINCYNCESIYSKDCGNSFDMRMNFQLDCDFTDPPRYIGNLLSEEEHNATGCMKRIYKENGIEKIVRSCFWGNINDTEIGCRVDPNLELDGPPICFVCDNEDYCNSAWSRWNPITRWWMWSWSSIAALMACLTRL